MATPLLGLALPAQGSNPGSWGTLVNNQITSLIDSAVAGATTLSTDADVTLTSSDETANQARQAILLWTATGTVTRNITAPYRSKFYIVVNSSSTQSIVLRAINPSTSLPTTGITIAPGEKCVAAWNSTDFVKASSSSAGTVTTVGFTGGIVSVGTPTTTPAFTVVGTSGGIVYFSASNTWASSATLTANSLVVGGGVGVTPSTVSNITTDNTYLQLGATTPLRFGNSGNTFYVALKGPSSSLANTTYTLPAAYPGTSGYVLSSDTSGNLSWVAGGGGGGGSPGGSSTQVQFNSSGAFGGSANFTWDGTNVQLGTQGALRFADADSSNFVGLRAPSTITNNTTYTLPAADTTTGGYVLSSNGAGVLSWVANGSGGGVTSVGVSPPVQNTGTSTAPVIAMAAAASGTNGYLTGTDWATFNGKQGAITLTTNNTSGAASFNSATNVLNIPNYATGGSSGVSSITGSAPLSTPNTTGAVTISIAAATTNVSGYLTASDWGVFNGKQDALSSTNRLPVSSGGTGQNTATAGFNSLSPMTTQGDIIYGGVNGSGTRLGAGTSGLPLLSGGTSGAPSWGTLSIGAGGTGATSTTAAFNALSPMTTQGDLIIGGTTGTGARLGIGTANQVLSVNSSGTNLVWATPSSGGSKATSTALGTVYGQGGDDGSTTGPTSFGYQAAFYTGTSQITAVGYQAGYACTGNSSTAIGTHALRGVSNGVPASGTQNTAVGYSAAYNISTAASNTAVGYYSLYSNTTGDTNACFGDSSGRYITTGAANTFLGQASGNVGSSSITGNNNICLGYSSTLSSASVSNTVTLGNANITTLRCATTSITAISDARDKKDVVDIPAGLSFVEKLRPVSFKWAMRNLSDDPKFTGKQDIPEFGFIAQDLQSVQVETGITVPNLVMDDNPDRIEAAQGNLLPILVKAIQELTARVRQLEAKNG